jgi:hypothetical protein
MNPDLVKALVMQVDYFDVLWVGNEGVKLDSQTDYSRCEGEPSNHQDETTR